MKDDETLEEHLRRWFHTLDLRHPAVRVLWKIALQQKKKEREEQARVS